MKKILKLVGASLLERNINDLKKVLKVAL